MKIHKVDCKALEWKNDAGTMYIAFLKKVNNKLVCWYMLFYCVVARY